MKKIFLLLLQLTAFMSVLGSSALANEPKPGGLGLQPAATPQMERLVDFHDNLLMWIITGITLFVLALMIWVIVRYNKAANPKPASFTHNVPIEILWTAIPIVILIVISVKSFSVLYYLDRAEDPDMTLKVSGYQWGWTYSYPDQEIEDYNSDIIPEEEIAEYIPNGQGRRLLEVYNPVVLPIDKNILIHVTAAPTDVIHSWAMPAFGIKKDAVPGRLNETWVRIKKTGVYFGQCSEICGISHAFMPISVYAVPEEEFTAWTECVKGDGASALYPARKCVQDLGLDKYRNSKSQDNKQENKFAQVTGANE